MSKNSARVIDKVMSSPRKTKEVLESIKAALTEKVMQRIREQKKALSKSLIESHIPDSSDLEPETDVDSEPTEKQKKDLSPDHIKESVKKN